MKSKVRTLLKVIFYLGSIFLFAQISFAGNTNNQSHTGGNSVDNGGELIALKFTRAGRNIIQSLENNREEDILNDSQLDAIRTAVDKTRVNAVKGPIRDNHGRVVDARFMRGDSGNGIIEIDEKLWRVHFRDKVNLSRIVLHEYLRAANINDDNYIISAKIKNLSSSILVASEKTQSGKDIVDRPEHGNYVFRDSSEANREGKTVHLGVGLGFDDGLSFHTTARYFIDPDWVADLTVSNSTLIVFGHAHNISLGVRHFLGNSFYTRLALTRRELILQDKIGSVIFSSNDEPSTLQDIGPQLSIGNQWQWKHFSLEIDWIGVYVPVSVIKKSDDMDSLNGADWKFLRFGIGATF